MRPVGEWDDKHLANLIADYQRLGRVTPIVSKSCPKWPVARAPD